MYSITISHPSQVYAGTLFSADICFHHSPIKTQSRLNSWFFPSSTEPVPITVGFIQIEGRFAPDATFIRDASLKDLESEQKNIGGGQLFKDWQKMVRLTDTEHKPTFHVPPYILFSNLSLKPGESKTFQYSIPLPNLLPPSFHGKSAKIFYRLLLGIVKGNITSKPHVIQTPIQILGFVDAQGKRPLYNMMEPIFLDSDDVEAFMSQQKSYKRPMIENEPQDSSAGHATWICEIASKASFDICQNNEPVCTISFLKTVLKTNDTLSAYLDFSNGSVPCFQVSVYLETTETVESQFSVKNKAQMQKASRKVYSEAHYLTLNHTRKSIFINVPPHLNSDIQTNLFSLHWQLRFVFATVSSDTMIPTFDDFNVSNPCEAFNREGKIMHFAQATASPEIKTCIFDCSIPLKIYNTAHSIRHKSFTFNL